MPHLSRKGWAPGPSLDIVPVCPYGNVIVMGFMKMSRVRKV